MKKAICVLLTAIISITASTQIAAADIFAVKPVLSVRGAAKICRISVAYGESLEFSAADLERRLELGGNTLAGVTVTSLPSLEQGELVVDGVELEPYEYLTRQEIDRLIFVPNEEAAFARMTLIPRTKGEELAAEVTISVVERLGRPPVARDIHCETVSNIAISKKLTSNASGESLRVQLASLPKNGAVRFNGMAFTYMPYKDASGPDKFTFYAIDSQSLYSNEATVTVNVEQTDETFYYADMATDPAAYAAIKLRELGVMGGSQIGDKSFFFPDKELSRGEFLTILIAAGGLEGSLQATVNTGLPDDADIPAHLKPYVRAAIKGGIWPSGQPFKTREALTRAEATALAGRVARLYSARGIPQPQGNAADSAEPLTNCFAASLAWEICKTVLR